MLERINKIEINKRLVVLVALFGVIYCLISLVNHANFRTFAWDLGLYNQTVYDYAHFRLNQNTVIEPATNNILSDHFTLLHFFISPLYWIFKSYTLLIVQIAAILFGGVGVYRYIKHKSGNENLSLLAAGHFFSLWGIYSALSFDYHDNVVAAMFVPWVIYYLAKDNYRNSAIFFLLLLISKENMIIWGMFLGLGLFLANYRDKKKRLFSAGLTFFSLLFFVLVMKLIMPALVDEGRAYNHFHYSVLGADFGEALKTILMQPYKTIKMLFINFLDNPEAIGIKKEFFIVFLVSGGAILWRKPQYLIILLPILGQKLYSDDYFKWSLSWQYSIEFAPILSIALFEYLSKYQNKHILRIGLLAVLIAGCTTYLKIEKRLPLWYNGVNMKFYAKEHYKTPYSTNKIKEAMALIPNGAKVSGESNIVAHLANRETIYQFPKIEDAEYIILLPGDDFYFPLSEENYKKEVGNLLLSKEWETLISSSDVVLLKKNE